jgi:hypothetical protein
LVDTLTSYAFCSPPPRAAAARPALAAVLIE